MCWLIIKKEKKPRKKKAKKEKKRKEGGKKEKERKKGGRKPETCIKVQKAILVNKDPSV